jgi:outer membrane receptor protein involved in Fe transport
MTRSGWARRAAALLLLSGLPLASEAEPGDSIEQVVVTATRVPEPADQVPANISVVTGNDIRARDANDLRTALSLVPGVEAPPAGDAGPSSAVPSFWGLHEFDAFLLVVDEVPWGGAFNPAISTLDLTDVEKIEVLKGAAPVMYGATSFVGVVHVLHYPAGQASDDAEVAGGSFASYRGAVSYAIPECSNFCNSLALSGDHIGFADRRETIDDGRLLYRGAWRAGADTVRIDADVTLVHDLPPSPIVRVGEALNTITPINANYQPADSKISENRYHLTLDYTRPTPWGTWETLASYAHSDIRDVRGFLRPSLVDDGSSANADSQNQYRQINDLYADTHLASEFLDGASLLVGADFLYGVGRQRSLNGEYYVPLDGLTLAPPTTSLHVDEINSLADDRTFAGQYVQLDWKRDTRWDVVAGVRLNETYEHKDSAHIDGFDPSLDEFDVAQRDVVRLSGTVGASYRAWSDADGGEGVVYADYRNAFKPAAVDFGPDNTPAILLPETAQSYEAGLKGRSGDVAYQLSVFREDFANLVVPNPVTGELENAAKERLQGAEFEAHYAFTTALSFEGAVAFHDARYMRFTTVDDQGNPAVVDGNELAMSPRVLASAGLLYTPAQGLNATVVATYAGHRWLNEENTAPASGYVVLDATMGYRWDRYAITLEATNLTNQRPPVSASEFGSQSFYLLPAQMLWVRLGASL